MPQPLTLTDLNPSLCIPCCHLLYLKRSILTDPYPELIATGITLAQMPYTHCVRRCVQNGWISYI
jgi:hypothetical protein